VQAEISSGRYASEEALVRDAVRAFRELSLRHQSLVAGVQQSVAEADRGEVTPLDTAATKAEARRQRNGPSASS